MVSHYSKISDGVFEGRATDMMGFSVSDKMGILFLLSLLIWSSVTVSQRLFILFLPTCCDPSFKPPCHGCSNEAPHHGPCEEKKRTVVAHNIDTHHFMNF